MAEDKVDLHRIKRWTPPERTERQQGVDLTSVAEAVKSSDVLFLHSILPYSVPSSTTAIKHDTSWQVKAALILTRGPDLATSFIVPGNDERFIVGRFGMAVANGTLTSVNAKDVGSVAHGSGSRTTISTPSAVEEQFLDTLRTRVEYPEPKVESWAFNEATVTRPASGPLYISLDQPEPKDGEFARRSDHPPSDEERVLIKDWAVGRVFDTPPHQEVYVFAEEYSIPVIVLQKGQPFLGVYDQERETYLPGEELTYDQVIQMTVEIDSDKREELLQLIVDAQPIQSEKIENLERYLTDAYINGKEAALALGAYRDISQFSGKYGDTVGAPGKIFRSLNTDGTLGFQMTYHERQGALIEETYKDGMPVRYYATFQPADKHLPHSKDDITVLKLTERPDCFTVEHLRDVTHVPLYSDKLYLDFGLGRVAVQHGLSSWNQYVSHISGILAGANPLSEEHRKFIKPALYHLYGFAQYALEHENNDLMDQVRDLVSVWGNPEEVEELIERRLDQQNRFLMTREEFLAIKKDELEAV